MRCWARGRRGGRTGRAAGSPRRGERTERPRPGCGTRRRRFPAPAPRAVPLPPPPLVLEGDEPLRLRLDGQPKQPGQHERGGWRVEPVCVLCC